MTWNSDQQVAACRAGTDPALICRTPSGWAVLANMQYLPGYTILLSDPVVASLNDLDREARSEYLCDMALIGDALLEVTGAYRVNYAVLGNQYPVLHAHIIPRFISEPDDIRHGGPWEYSDAIKNGTRFDPERDRELIQKLARAIQERLSSHFK